MKGAAGKPGRNPEPSKVSLQSRVAQWPHMPLPLFYQAGDKSCKGQKGNLCRLLPRLDGGQGLGGNGNVE